MPINPYVKKALSAILVAVVGALLIAIQQQLVPLAPAATQPTIIALIAGLAHYLDAWGHTERVAAAADKVLASKRAPSVPPFSMLMLVLLTLVLACGLPGCSLFGPGGSVWPAVARCAPSETSLIEQAAAILLAGGDYEAALLELAKKTTKEAVVCAVQAATAELGSAGKVSASPTKVAAAARGEAFLKKTGNAQ